MENKKSASKIFGVVFSVLYIILMALLLLGIIVNVNKKPNQVNGILGYSFAVVQSNSMYPIFQAGDVVIIKQTNINTLNVGDIIVFYDYVDEKDVDIHLEQIDVSTYTTQARTDQSLGRASQGDAINSGNSKLIIHRVCAVFVDDYGVRFFQTKGDNNNSFDENYVREDFVCAKYVQSGGFLQSVFQFVATPKGLVIVIILPVILTVIIEIFSVVKNIKNSKIAENLLRRKIRFAEIDKEKIKLSRYLNNPEKVYLYDISQPEDKTNLAIVLWENDVDEALILYDQSREKFYDYFQSKFTVRENKQLQFLKIKADLIKKNALLSDEEVDTKAKVIYNEQKEKIKNVANKDSNNC